VHSAHRKAVLLKWVIVLIGLQAVSETSFAQPPHGRDVSADDICPNEPPTANMLVTETEISVEEGFGLVTDGRGNPKFEVYWVERTGEYAVWPVLSLEIDLWGVPRDKVVPLMIQLFDEKGDPVQLYRKDRPVDPWTFNWNQKPDWYDPEFNRGLPHLKDGSLEFVLRVVPDCNYAAADIKLGESELIVLYTKEQLPQR
jgi:hypothetical protein